MPVSLNFQANTKQIEARMANLALKQIPFATAKALTLTAKELVNQNERDTAQIFNSPTNWTVKAFRFIPAKKNNPRTFILRKDRPATTNVPRSKQNYLEDLQTGGGRKPKAFEGALSAKAKGANKFRYATPTRSSRLNKAGNISRNAIDKILAETGVSGSKLFIPRSDSGLALKGGDGVFQRMARGKVKKLLHLTNATPNYRKTFNFYGRMQKYGRSKFPKIFQREFRAAILSSKRVR